MRYFSEEDARAWHNNLSFRASKDDACASLRIFTRQLDEWLRELPLPDLGLLWVDFDPAMRLKEDLRTVKDIFSRHFIIPGNQSVQRFIQKGEDTAGYLLAHRLHKVWQEFCGSIQQKCDRRAFERTIIAINDLERYFMSRRADAILKFEFQRKVHIPWEYLRGDILARGYEFIPSGVIASLWCGLADLVLDAVENYGFPDSGGWWTDVVEGQFRHLAASQAVSGAAGTKKADGRNADLAGNIAAHISGLRGGRIPEASILEVLIYLLKAANELAQWMDAAAAHRKVSRHGSRQN